MEMVAAAREASVPDPRVLLIEQEGPFAETLIAAFEAEGIRADWARTGADGLALKAKLCPDIVLVGFRLPDMSEIDVVSQLVTTRDCGVVVLSDMTNEAARETCLDYGADDYLPSHAIVWDAVARVRAVQRRLTRQVRTAAAEDPGAVLVIGPVRINLRHRTVHALDGRRIALTSAEYTMLETLAKANGHALSRDRLSEAALRRPWRTEDRSVDQLVFNLRQKLPSDGERGSLIQSVRGSGYWMRAPDRPAYQVIGLDALERANSAGATHDVQAVTA